MCAALDASGPAVEGRDVRGRGHGTGPDPVHPGRPVRLRDRPLPARWPLGHTPDFLAGHSIGELAAAHAAGLWSLEDAARAGRRPRPPHAGTSRPAAPWPPSKATEDEILPLLDGRRSSIAAVNGPDLHRHLRRRGRRHRPSPTTRRTGPQDQTAHRQPRLPLPPHGTHARRVPRGRRNRSPPLAHPPDRLQPHRHARRPRRTRPPDYWVRHVREAVRFADAMRTLADQSATRFLEIGPDGILTALAADALEDTASIATLRQEAPETRGTRHRPSPASTSTAPPSTGPPSSPAPAPPRRPAHLRLPTPRYWLEPTPLTEPVEADTTDARFWETVEREDLDTLVESLAIAPETPFSEVLPALSSWRREVREHSAAEAWHYRVVWRPRRTGGTAAQAPAGRWLLIASAGNAEHALVTGVVRALAGRGTDVATVLLPCGPTGRRWRRHCALSARRSAVCCPCSGWTKSLWRSSRPCPPASPAPSPSSRPSVTSAWPARCGWPPAVPSPSAPPMPSPGLPRANSGASAGSSPWSTPTGGVGYRSARRARRPHAGATGRRTRRPAGREPARPAPLRHPRPPPHPHHPPPPPTRTGGPTARSSSPAAPAPSAPTSPAGSPPHGARHLILTSRRGPDAPGAAELAAELENLGADVTIAACDVSDRDALAALLADPRPPAQRRRPHRRRPRRRRLDTLTPDRSTPSCAAKAAAAAHLHELTRDRDLDAFVLFSSVAGCSATPARATTRRPTPTWTRLAEHRRALGLPATSIAWGPGPSGGMATGPARRRGCAGAAGRDAPGRAVAALGATPRPGGLLSRSADVDWARVRAGSPVRPPYRPVLRRLVARRAAGRAGARPAEDSPAGSCAAALPAASGTRRCWTWSATEVAAVLGHAVGRRGRPRARVQGLGFDSLTAVELRNRLDRRHGAAAARHAGLRLPDPGRARRPPAGRARRRRHGVGRAGAPHRCRRSDDDPIAIVGMSCRYPGGVARPRTCGACSPTGADAISGFPADRGWDVDGLYDPDPDPSGRRTSVRAVS